MNQTRKSGSTRAWTRMGREVKSGRSLIAGWRKAEPATTRALRLLLRVTGTAAAMMLAAFAVAFLAAPGMAQAQQAQDEVTFTWEVDGTEVTQYAVAEGAGTVDLVLKATLTDDTSAGEGTGTVSGVKFEFNPNGWGGTGSGRATRGTDWSYSGTPPDGGGEWSSRRFTGENHAQTLNLQLTIRDDSDVEGDETIVVTYTNEGELNTSRDNITIVNPPGRSITITI